MEVDEICDSLSGFRRADIRYMVKRMLDGDQLQRNFGYYTPSANGLALYDKAMNPQAKPTPTQHSILSLFEEFGEMTANQLSLRTFRVRRSANHMIATLAKLGWLEGVEVYKITRAGRDALIVDDEIEEVWRLPKTDDIVRQALATQVNSVFNLGK